MEAYKVAYAELSWLSKVLLCVLHTTEDILYQQSFLISLAHVWNNIACLDVLYSTPRILPV